jgi:DNA-directed RNA polymerase subunit RPC12/RpoP
VAFTIPRPWPQWRRRPDHSAAHRRQPGYRHRHWGPLNIRASKFRCFVCEGTGKVPDPPPSYIYEPAGYRCPECKGLGFDLCPTRRRPYFTWATWRFGEREAYFPPLVTVWHVDPDKGGDDDSCRRDVRTRQQAAYREGRPWANAVLWWRFKHMHKWCFRHMRPQVITWQRLQRWRKVRCPACGERFGWSESGIAPGFDMPAYHFKCAETRGFGMQAAEKEPVA